MRHLKSGKRLGLGSAHRKALLKNLVTSLMVHGRIRTTVARAKELRKVADRIITLSRRITPADLAALSGDELTLARARRVHAVRMARRWIDDRVILEKIFSEYSTRFATRPGGYTRILRLGVRPGDQAAMALIELVTEAYPVVSDEASADADDVDGGSDGADTASAEAEPASDAAV